VGDKNKARGIAGIPRGAGRDIGMPRGGAAWHRRVLASWRISRVAPPPHSTPYNYQNNVAHGAKGAAYQTYARHASVASTYFLPRAINISIPQAIF